MTQRIFRPAYVIDELGELGRLPDGAIVNIGGVSNPTFTVGGRQVMFADQAAGSGGTGNATLQSAYANSTDGMLYLNAGKDLILTSVDGNGLIVDGATGTVTVLGNLIVGGLVNGVDLDGLSDRVANLDNSLNSHLGSTSSPKHNAAQISADTATLTKVSGSNVQQVIESIDRALSNTTTAPSSTRGFEYVQESPEIIWTIVHGGNTRRVSVTVWDEGDNMTFADTVSIIDPNSVRVVFNTPAKGRAILMLF